MSEYFKIEETLKLIKIAKENNSQKETITKNYINHLSKNINLMRESANFEKRRILQIIKDNEYLETDDRHTQGFQSGIKLAFKLIKDALQEEKK